MGKLILVGATLAAHLEDSVALKPETLESEFLAQHIALQALTVLQRDQVVS
jgi:hypothetical protein